MANVQFYPASRLDAEQVREFGASQVAIATGARWRRDGYGRSHQSVIPGTDAAHVMTPDDVMEGKVLTGPVVIYDDDHYYLGGVLAEKLRNDGLDVTLVTTESKVSIWTENTLEQHRIQARLLKRGVTLVVGHKLVSVAEQAVTVACIYGGPERSIDAAAVVMVTSRWPVDELYSELTSDTVLLHEAAIQTVRRIGDCHGPATIAAAVYEGHRYARELGTTPDTGVGFHRELTELSDK